MIRTGLFIAAVSIIAGTAPAWADVVISSDATQNMSCSGGICMPTETDAVLNVTDLENLLASGNVSVVTTNGSVQANGIDITAALSWSGASGLTLDAYESISFSAAVNVQGTGSVSLVTDDGGSSGALTFAAMGNLVFADTTDGLTINGQTYQLESTLKQLAVAVVAKPSGRFALSKDCDAGKDGLYYNSPIPIPFRGSFNGLGHAISNLEVVDTSDQFVGLFAYVEPKAWLAGIALRNVILRGALRSSAGALAGVNEGTISNSSVSGDVSGGGATGGVAGENFGTITTSHSAAHVHTPKGSGGGLVGLNGGTISLSFATGKISGEDVGGLIGNNGGAGSVENSYALGGVTDRRKNGSVGGLVGFNYLGTIATSYSTGAVGGRKGVLIGGFDGADEGTIATSYWDTDISGTDEGSGDGNDAGLTGLTTEQFLSGLPAGFDSAIWAEDSGINNGFPYLVANPPAK